MGRTSMGCCRTGRLESRRGRGWLLLVFSYFGGAVEYSQLQFRREFGIRPFVDTVKWLRLKFRLKRDNSVLTFCPGISLYHFALSVLPLPFSIRSLALTALPFLLFPLSLSFFLSLSLLSRSHCFALFGSPLPNPEDMDGGGGEGGN